MYVQWQGMSTVETRCADTSIRNASDNADKYHERTATACDSGFQTVLDRDK
jgi:hypothetical protein